MSDDLLAEVRAERSRYRGLWSDHLWPTWWLIYRRSVRPLFMVQAEAMRDAFNAHLTGSRCICCPCDFPDRRSCPVHDVCDAPDWTADDEARVFPWGRNGGCGIHDDPPHGLPRWVRPWSRLAQQDPVWHRLLARLCREAWPGTSGGRWVLYMPDGSVVEGEP